MLKRYKRFITLISISSLFISANAQKLNYKIFFNKDYIGNLVAERDIQKERSHYLLKSKMTVDKIINVSIEYRLEGDFVNQKLTRSSAYQKVNNKVQVSSNTQWDGSAYNIQTIDKSTILRNKPIGYNLCSLYFNEPVNVKEVYSDTFGEFLKLKSLGKHRYELQLPDGKKNFYSYNAGICYQVETEQLFSKITFLLTH